MIGKRSAVIALSAAVLVGLWGCGSDEPQAAPGTERGHTFVGRVMGTDAFIAILTNDDGDQVGGYFTDGKGISVWMGLSSLDKGVGGLVNRKDSKQVGVVAVSLAGKESSGSLVIDDKDYAFAAREVKGRAGLYHKVERESSIVVAETGWVRLDDGSYRGTRTTKTGTAPAAAPEGSPVIWDDPQETYPWIEPQSSPVR